MQLRSKKAKEIKGFLRRPQTLRPEFTLDINVEDYIRQKRKYKYYSALYWDLYSSIHSGNSIINLKSDNTYLNLLVSYKNDNTLLENEKLNIVNTYNKLKNSEMYDSSICKMGLLEREGKYYLAIHFPKLFLTVANSDREPIELRDCYFYIVSSSLYLFRTTLDVVNPKFIHPHVQNNFTSYCLGDSPLRASLETLRYSTDDYTEDDADIFWVNFYRTITQKTEIGDHFYALDKLNRGIELDWLDFLTLVFNNEDFMQSFNSYINILPLQEEIKVIIDREAIKKDFFMLLSTESNDIPDASIPLGTNVIFNNKTLKEIKLTKVYNSPRKIYSNIDSLLEMLIIELSPVSFINNTYDDYKEKLKQSNNSGEQSVGQNQIFEFQML